MNVSDFTTAHEEESTDQPTVMQLQTQLADANRQIEDLKETFKQQKAIEKEYTENLDNIKKWVREFKEGQDKYLQTAAKHWASEVEDARRETMEAQLTHQTWQSRLQRLDEGISEAFKAREMEGMPYRKRIAALKEENRILRLKVGWEPPEDSDEDDWDEEDGMPVDESGRGSRARERIQRAAQAMLVQVPD